MKVKYNCYSLICILFLSYFVMKVSYVSVGFPSVNIPRNILLILGALAIVGMLQGKELKIHKSALLLFFFMVVVFATVILQIWLYEDQVDHRGLSAHNRMVAYTGMNFFWLLVGYLFASKLNIKLDFKVVLMFFLMVLFFVLIAPKNGFVINYSSMNQLVGYDRTGWISHLTLGSEAALILMLMYSFVDGTKGKSFVFIASVLALFAIGGRAELLFFISTVFIYELLLKQGAKKINYLVFIGFFFFVFGLIYLYLDIKGTEGFQHMMFSSGLEEDSSFNKRLAQFHNQWKNLGFQFFIGNTSLIVKEQGSVGGYIHSILSAWQYYGFFIFSMLVYFILRLIFLSKKQNNYFMLIYSINVFQQIVFAKSITYLGLWFAVGAYFYIAGINSGESNKRLVSNIK